MKQANHKMSYIYCVLFHILHNYSIGSVTGNHLSNGTENVRTAAKEHLDVTNVTDVSTVANSQSDVVTATEHLDVTNVTDVSTVANSQSDVVTSNVTPPILIGLSSSTIHNVDAVSTSDSPVDYLPTITEVEISSNYSDLVTTGTHSLFLSFTLESNFYSIFFLSICWGGLLGNSISLILLNRKHMQQLPCRLILIALTCNDSIYLLIHVAYPVLSEVINYYTWACIGEMYANLISLYFSKFLIMGISLERFLVICFPIKAKTILSKKTEMIYCVISILAILAVGGYGPHFYEVVLFETEHGPSHQCALSSQGISYATNAWVWVELGLTLIPTVVIVVCTITMIVALVRSAALKGRTDSSNDAVQNNLRAASMLLVTICVAFIVLGMPIIIYLVINPEVYSSVQNWDTLGYIFLVMEMLNSAGNCVFYIAGGPMFRKEIKVLYQEVAI